MNVVQVILDFADVELCWVCGILPYQAENYIQNAESWQSQVVFPDTASTSAHSGVVEIY